jgi:uncharacterized RDD family membrane protein YckC
MQQPDYSISTPENVDLHLELAGMGNRVLACLIDTTITYAVLFAVMMVVWGVVSLLSLFAVENTLRSIVVAVLTMITIFILFCIMFGYYILFEGIWQGQTPGKRLAGIRVIETTGQPVGWSGVIIRNLIRTLDQGVAFVGLIPMLVDKQERRFGDFAANTIVIRERKSALLAPELLLVDNSPNLEMIDVGRITPQEYDLIVSFLKRRETMSKSQRPLVAQQLAKFMQDKLSAPSIERTNDERFLESVYSAYRARAQS